MECTNCKKETKNKKFCSRNCAATYNNKKYPKRTKTVSKCIICDTTIPHRRKYCTKHNPNYKDWNSITLGQLIDERKYQKHSKIRTLSKKAYDSSNSPKQCKICGYNKHYEVCHIKPISSFSNDTPISIVNALTNLVALCRNCHWELDNGIISL